MESYMECLGRNSDVIKGFDHILRKAESVEMDIIVYVKKKFCLNLIHVSEKNLPFLQNMYIYIQYLSTRYLGLLLLI